MRFLTTFLDILTLGLAWPLTNWLAGFFVYCWPEFDEGHDEARERAEDIRRLAFIYGDDDPIVFAWKERQELSARQLH
ncbi:hypothetical protein ACSBOB_19995 [Mesorhizobium sp. ASY16-5R]|uniref:hypothetical protein n=1 Tax=Mesorhizobium sp. ASY16-5R TaxID=3445772 RepID=UPI003FA035D4